MALSNTTFRYQYGIAISEIGLNKISKALRVTKPGLFAKDTKIPIKAKTDTEEAHILDLYAMVDKESLIFDIYPISKEPGAPQDSFSILVKINFSLTDNILGLITRLGATIEASAQITRSQKLNISLLSFKVLKIEDEHPQFPVQLINGSLNASEKISSFYNIKSSTDPQLADSLTALVNYLIDLFLKDALTKTIIEFPVPDLSTIAKVGTLNFPIEEVWGPFLRNNTFYTMLGMDLNQPTSFPVEYLNKADIRVGISKSGLDRVANALLPMKIPDVNINHDYNTFYVHAYNIQIESVDFYLKPGNDLITTRLFFSGIFQIDIQFDVPVINKHCDIPIPIPLDKLSHYFGKISPNLVIDPLNNPDGQVHLHLIPDVRFLDEWYVFVLTDYRDFMANFIRGWVDKFKDFFILKFLRHIPIIGWILDKVIDMTGWVLGYLLGAYLDYVVSTWLNLLINVLGRAAIAIFWKPDFDIYQLPQKTLKDVTGLIIQSGEVAIVDDGRDGEVELRLLFEQGILPKPLQTTIDPIRKPKDPIEKLPPVEGIVHLNEYSSSDFFPTIALPPPSFAVTTQRFQVTVLLTEPEPKTIIGNVSINYFKDGDRWNIQKSTTIADIGTETATIIYDNTFKVQHLDNSAGTASSVSYHVSGEVDWLKQTITIASNGDSERSISFYPNIPIEVLDFWIYRLAFTDLSAINTGFISKLSLASRYEVDNWLRTIPLRIISIIPSSVKIENPVKGGPELTRSLYIVSVIDDEGSYELKIFKDGGLYQASVKQKSITLFLNNV